MRLKEQQQGNGSSKSGGSGGGGCGKSGGKSAAAAPGPDPADDPFTAALSKILSSTGGVQQERHVPLLLQLVRRARSKAQRTALLVVLQRSAGEVQRQAVAGRLLLELQGWLTDAVDEGDAKRAQNCLACLDKLPVTLAALQPPCELGKVVGKLRKHDSFGAAITDTAKRLVARWKGVVEAAQAKKAAGAAGGSTARSANQLPLMLPLMPMTTAALRLPCTCVICSTPACQSALTPAIASQPLHVVLLHGVWSRTAKAACALSSHLPGTALVHTSQGLPTNCPTNHTPLCLPSCPCLCSATTAAKPAAAAAAKPTPAAAAKPAAVKPAAAGAAANERQASGSLAGMADGDLFKSADRQRAGVRDAVPAVKKVGGLLGEWEMRRSAFATMHACW